MSDYEMIEIEEGSRVRAWSQGETVMHGLGDEPLSVTKLRMMRRMKSMSELWSRVAQIVGDIEYKPGYRLVIGHDDENRIFIQVECWRPDTHTGEMGWGRGGRGYPTESMGRSEIVRMAFGLFVAYETHECREAFQYRERRVFGPHIDIDAQWEAAGHLEYEVKKSD